VPLGLRAIFQAMQSPGYCSYYTETTPEHFSAFPAALRANAFVQALKDATDQEFPDGKFGKDGDLLASECPEVICVSSFWAGVAACWFYMNALNGKDGA
jgi:hypothetical protein